MIESINDLNGSKEYPWQTATELVVPYNIRTGEIDYQVWVQHQDQQITRHLNSLLESDVSLYRSKGISLALGTAYNLGWLEYVGLMEVEETRSGSDWIDSAVPLSKMRKVEVDAVDEESRLIREELPVEFDEERNLTGSGLADIIVNMNGSSVPAIVDQLVVLSNGQKVTWME